ncbi:hypothetical protein ABVK25_012360 [Lepraria finkii]|uniref:SGNH hydrolase-type esterase domain-containing protein n=1 Tax=Lepraria finkii TaxID=1340010 RepID=A0ABR4AHL6_9LECA
MNSTLPKSLRILCFGDSLTAGYTSHGYEHHPYADHLRVGLEHMLSSSSIEVEVAGLSGDQVQGQYLQRIKAKCPTEKGRLYDWIIIMGGTNDLGWGQRPEDIYEGLKKVWDIALNTGANIMALNVLEAAGLSPRMIEKKNMLNAMIKDHQQDRFYNFDLYSKIPYATLDEAARARLWDDGLHLTGEGYKMMGNVIAVRLFEILQEQTNAKNVASTKEDIQGENTNLRR